MNKKEDTRRHNKELYEAKGNITVEAAFIMPIVIFTIFALIYLSFIVHDRCRIQGIVDNILHKATLTVKHEADIRTGTVDYEVINDRGVFYILIGNQQLENRRVENYLLQELKGGLFLFQITSAKAEVDAYHITIQVKAVSKITLPYFHGLFKQFSHINIENSAPIHNPVDAIRCTEVILDTGSNIKGVNELKGMLENFISSSK